MIFSRVNVPDSHLLSTFESFDWSEGKKMLKGHFELFTQAKRKGMVLLGEPGRGKTHLMVATYYDLQHKGLFPGSDVIFFDWQMLLNYLRAGFSSDIRADIAVQKICGAKFLLVDDIKPEPRGDFWKQILEQLIEHSYMNKVKIIFSTNADNFNELVTRWGLQDYHASRLLHIADIMVLRGIDRRIEKPIKK